MTETLIAGRKAQAVRNDQVVLGAVVGAGDLGLVVAELVERTALPARTIRASVDRLKSRGLVVRRGERGAILATPAGQSETGATDQAGMATGLSKAIAEFPSEAQRAFVRLLISGIVARYHLHAHYEGGWPGFIAVGPSKSGKTAAATFATWAFGIPTAKAVRLLRRNSPGEIFGRRRQISEGWVVDRSPLMDLPFLCLDEYDKASDELHREAEGLLYGSTRPDVAGTVVEVRPLVMVALNARPGDLDRSVNEAFVRRSVVIDTEPLMPLLGDLDVCMRRLFRPGSRRIPRVDLRACVPPEKELPDVAWNSLRSALLDALTPLGRRLVDVEAVSRLALGRAALASNSDLGCAAAETALDYVRCAATVEGHAKPDAVPRLQERIRGVPSTSLAPSAGAAVSDQEALVVHRQQRAVTAAAEDLEFVKRREMFVAGCDQLARRLGRDPRPHVRAWKAVARKARDRARSARSNDALLTIVLASKPDLAAADAWVQQRDLELQQAQERKRAEIARRQQDRIWERRQREAEQQQRRSERERWQTARARLRRMMPYASTGKLLEDLADAGWIRRVPIEREPPRGFGKLVRPFLDSCYYVCDAPFPGVSAGEVAARNVETFFRAAYVHAERQAIANGARPSAAPRIKQAPAPR